MSRFKDVKIGGCAYLKAKERYVFYLVTKGMYYHKPNYFTIEKSLLQMKQRCEELNVTELAMPTIGCGLDNLDWSIVARIIDQIFENSNIKITVYKPSGKKPRFNNYV